MSSPVAARRRGMAILVIIVLMAIATVTLVSVVRLAAAHRERVRRDLWQVQAAWLAESAIERAAARLADEPGYSGETWRISSEDLGGPDAAVVAIRVEPVPGRPDERLVRVQADCPDDPIHRARAVKELTIEIPKGNAK